MRQRSAAALLCQLRPYTRLQLVLPVSGGRLGVAVSDHYLSEAGVAAPPQRLGTGAPPIVGSPSPSIEPRRVAPAPANLGASCELCALSFDTRDGGAAGAVLLHGAAWPACLSHYTRATPIGRVASDGAPCRSAASHVCEPTPFLTQPNYPPPSVLFSQPPQSPPALLPEPRVPARLSKIQILTHIDDLEERIEEEEVKIEAAEGKRAEALRAEQVRPGP